MLSPKKASWKTTKQKQKTKPRISLDNMIFTMYTWRYYKFINNMKKVSDILMDEKYQPLKTFIEKNWESGYWVKCEACGEMNPKASMECVIVDEERTPALVCPKCYYIAEEKADEHKEYDILPGECEVPQREYYDDPKESALNDIAQGRW